MSLLFIDGFDVADFAIKWTSINSFTSSTTTRFGSGRSMSSNFNGQTANKRVTASARITAGYAWQQTWGALSQTLCYLSGDAGATQHLTLVQNADGTVSVKRGATVLATSTAAFSWANTWHYIEIQATIDPTAGTVEVHIDGAQVILFTGNTKNGGTASTIDTFSIYSATDSGAKTGYIDDCYILNGLGTDNTSFLGDVRVQTLIPNGAGSSTQLTPTGSATNWQNTSDVPYNAARYNASPTAGQRDTYAMSDLLVNTGTIFGVQDVAHMFKSDAGPANMKPALKSGGSVYYDPTQALLATNSVYPTIREVDPATTAAWTVSGVNALEFGAEVA